MRLIDADVLLEELKLSSNMHAENSREFSLLHRDIVIVNEQPTVDAIPVEFIEKQIESAEWTITHIGNSDYYGNTCEELSLKCYILRSLINKWRDE